MSVLFMDGFDHYATSSLSRKWLLGPSAAWPSIIPTTSRHTGRCLRTLNAQDVNSSFDAAATCIVGAAVKIETPPVSGRRCLFQYTSNQVPQLCVSVNAYGRLAIHRGSVTGPVVAVSAQAVPFDTYFYLEAKASFGTASTVQVAVNTAFFISASVNSSGTGGSTANGVGLGAWGSADALVLYDDLYVANSLGTTNNTFLGDCFISLLEVNGAGSLGALTSSVSGYEPYTLINRSSDSVTYVQGPVPGARSSYAMESLQDPLPATVNAVQLNAAAVGSSVSGSSQMNTFVRRAGVTTDGSTRTLTSQLRYVSQAFDFQPSGASWTPADLVALEAGVRAVTSNGIPEWTPGDGSVLGEGGDILTASSPFRLRFTSGLAAFNPGLPTNAQPLPLLVNSGGEITTTTVLRSQPDDLGQSIHLGPTIGASATASTSTFDLAGNWYLEEAALVAFGPPGDIALPRLRGVAIRGDTLFSGYTYQTAPGSLSSTTGFTYSFDWATSITSLPNGNEWGAVAPVVGASVGIPFIDNTGAGNVLVFGFEAYSPYNPSGTLPFVKRHFMSLVGSGLMATLVGEPFDTAIHNIGVVISADQSLATLYLDGVDTLVTLALPPMPPPARAVYLSAGVSWPDFSPGAPSSVVAGIDNIVVSYGNTF